MENRNSIRSSEDAKRALVALGFRKRNTIPKGDSKITFKEDHLRIGVYDPVGNRGMRVQREVGLINAVIERDDDGSSIVTGREYELAIPKNALHKLLETIERNGGNYILNNRTFMVSNKEYKRYMFRELI